MKTSVWSDCSVSALRFWLICGAENEGGEDDVNVNFALAPTVNGIAAGLRNAAERCSGSLQHCRGFIELDNLQGNDQAG